MKTTRTIVTTTKTELRITASEIRKAFNLPDKASLIVPVRYYDDGDLELDDDAHAVTATTETTDTKEETE